MPIFATDTPRFSDAVKYEFDPSLNYTREVVTINDVAQTIVPGTVLGKVTATGKYKVALSAAVDGSQTPAALYAGSSNIILAASTDTTASVIVRGPVLLNDAGLTLGAGITISAVKTAFAAMNPPILFNTGV